VTRSFLLLLAGALLLPAAAQGEAFDPTGRPDSPAERVEVGGLPVLGFDSDTGLLLGALANLAAFDGRTYPYAWRLQVTLAAAFKSGPEGLTTPLHDDLIALDVPGLRGDSLRLAAEVSFRRSHDASWYGPGGDSTSATPPGLPAEEAAPYHRYRRTGLAAALNGRWRLREVGEGPARQRLEGVIGGEVALDAITVIPGSLLAAQLEEARGSGPDAELLRDLLRGTGSQLVPKLRLGLLHDSRDHEVAPTRGALLELSTRLAPAPATLRHAGFLASATGFLPLGDRLVLGGRLLGDAIVGHPPFYALSEAGVLTPRFTPGGAFTGRGILLQRFSGKLKLAASGELRGELSRFSVGAARFRLGLVAFVDGGRVWADWHRVMLAGRDADGPWSRLTLGLGSGLRLRWGETLVVRVDVAHSPTERTNGLYVTVGEAW
jgi:hypothetical protein